MEHGARCTHGGPAVEQAPAHLRGLTNKRREAQAEEDGAEEAPSPCRVRLRLREHVGPREKRAGGAVVRTPAARQGLQRPTHRGHAHEREGKGGIHRHGLVYQRGHQQRRQGCANVLRRGDERPPKGARVARRGVTEWGAGEEQPRGTAVTGAPRTAPLARGTIV